ncbi:putative aminopeptidase [Calothrix sp. NIES-2100]|uniref:M28 family metallopeptidase n=1 Tax=Calothrix sp. NIES-2100 TaxID=1954172 RepID=UPI000B5F97B8|nr:putative aminopeptidase [Calothrix sp. NIES-2100]
MTLIHKKHTNSWLKAALVAVMVSLPTACTIQSNRINNINASLPKAEAQESDRPHPIYADVQALVNFGPRVAGTPVMEKASAYLIERYRQAGYVAQVQTFNYEKFLDLGSNLIVNGTTIEGKALKGSINAKLSAPLVAVPNFGEPNDFAKVRVKGAIAIVRRGKIRFSQKAKNAAAAGAIGLVIVNNKPGNLTGAELAEKVTIPVLGISGDRGHPLLVQTAKVNVSLNVNAQQQVVTGRNVIAHLPGVNQPKLILGGHYDSVESSPGANDNASGTAVVLRIASNLANTNLAHQVWFVAFDGEEDGLYGSQAFVETAKPEFLAGLKGMLNFDMVGVNNQLLIGGTSSLTAIAQTVDSDIKPLGSYGYGGSDHASFANKNVPILFFFRGDEPNYHSENDKTVDPKLLDEASQVGLGIVKQLLQGE